MGSYADEFQGIFREELAKLGSNPTLAQADEALYAARTRWMAAVQENGAAQPASSPLSQAEPGGYGCFEGHPELRVLRGAAAQEQAEEDLRQAEEHERYRVEKLERRVEELERTTKPTAPTSAQGRRILQLQGQMVGLADENTKLVDEVGVLQKANSSLVDEVGQLRVQLAGCLTAAEGHHATESAKPGDYGWSPAYEAALNLRRAYELAMQRTAVPSPKPAYEDPLLRKLKAHDAAVAAAGKVGVEQPRVPETKEQELARWQEAAKDWSQLNGRLVRALELAETIIKGNLPEDLAAKAIVQMWAKTKEG